MGCALCLLGSVVIVLHAPPDKPVETIEEILHYALQPGTYNLNNMRRTTNIDFKQDFFSIVLLLQFSLPS